MDNTNFSCQHPAESRIYYRHGVTRAIYSVCYATFCGKHFWDIDSVPEGVPVRDLIEFEEDMEDDDDEGE